jgi:hypothetical protein
MGFYRAECRYTYAGQQMQNTLYYRDRDPFTGDLVVQARTLGEKLNEWFFPALSPLWPGLMPTSMHWDTWQVMPLEDIGFGNALSNPVSVAINVDGQGDVECMPPGNVVIFAFVLRTALITSGLYMPKRSYLSIGPINVNYVDNVGRLESVAMTPFNNLAALFAGNVGTIAGVGGWAPVRYGQGPAPLSLQGFAEVDGCVARQTLSYRKSRQPE